MRPSSSAKYRWATVGRWRASRPITSFRSAPPASSAACTATASRTSAASVAASTNIVRPSVWVGSLCVSSTFRRRDAIADARTANRRGEMGYHRLLADVEGHQAGKLGVGGDDQVPVGVQVRRSAVRVVVVVAVLRY